MTYNVFGGTLSLTQSITHSLRASFVERSKCSLVCLCVSVCPRKWQKSWKTADDLTIGLNICYGEPGP